jgi:predicted RNA-binding protein with PUA-like domain
LQVVKEAYPDSTQFDSSSKYYDKSSSQDKPKWVQVRHVACSRCGSDTASPAVCSASSTS